MTSIHHSVQERYVPTQRVCVLVYVDGCVCVRAQTCT